MRLTDVLPVTRAVSTSVGEFVVHGIGTYQIGQLLQQFPDLLSIIERSGAKVETLIQMAPDLVTSVIVIGAIDEGEDVEAATRGVRNLTLVDQFKLFEAILELTMPGGVVPFVVSVKDLVKRLSRGDVGKAPDTSSPPPVSD